MLVRRGRGECLHHSSELRPENPLHYRCRLEPPLQRQYSGQNQKPHRSKKKSKRKLGNDNTAEATTTTITTTTTPQTAQQQCDKPRPPKEEGTEIPLAQMAACAASAAPYGKWRGLLASTATTLKFASPMSKESPRRKRRGLKSCSRLLFTLQPTKVRARAERARSEVSP